MYVVIQLPNTVAETLGTGGTVKFRSPCPVIVQLVGVGNVATLNGTDTFAAPAVGDYLFENTCDCNGFYQVTSTGDMTDGCCVTPITNAAGELIGITVAGVEYLNPTPVTYTWSETNSNDGDGVIEYTGVPSDGSANSVITLAEPTVDTNTIPTGATITNGIVTSTFTDIDGNPLPDQTLDLNALVSSDHPAFVGTGSATATFDAITNTWTIDSSGGADTDNKMTLTVNADGSQTWQEVDIDGNPVGSPQVIPAAVDTDISAVRAELTETELTVGVTENGTELTDTISLHPFTCDVRPAENILVSAREVYDLLKPARYLAASNLSVEVAPNTSVDYLTFTVPECGFYIIHTYVRVDWDDALAADDRDGYQMWLNTTGLNGLYDKMYQGAPLSPRNTVWNGVNATISGSAQAGAIVTIRVNNIGINPMLIKLANITAHLSHRLTR